MRPPVLLLALVLALFLGLLPVCGGPEEMPGGFSLQSEGEGTTYGAELFAYVPGARYHYLRDMTPNLPEAWFEVVTAVSPTADGTLISIEDVGVVSWAIGRHEGKTWFVNDHGVFLLGPHSYRGELGTQGETHEWLDPPVVLLAFPIQVGKSWVSESGHLGLRVTVLAEETVTVPAGTFDCVKVETVSSDPTTASNDLISVGTWWWFAPGVGVVKRVYGWAYYYPPAGDETDTVWELLRIDH